MAWMDEQIRERKAQEEAQLQEAFFAMANAVMYSGEAASLHDARKRTGHAIQQVLSYYGIAQENPPEDMEELSSQLEYMLNPHGVLWRGVKLEKGWYRDAYGAMLASLKSDGTIVALIPNALGRYSYLSSDGKRHWINRKNQADFQPEALCFYRTYPYKPLSIPELFRFMLHSLNAGDAVFALLAVLVTTLLGTLLPRITSQLFSTVLVEKSLSLLGALATLYISVIISRALISAVYNLLMERISTKVSTDVQAATMIRVLNMPASFFRDFNSGELNSRIQSVGGLCTLLLSVVLSSSLSSLLSLIYVGQISHFAPSMLLPALMVLLLTVGVSILTALIQERYTLKKMKLDSQEAGLSYALVSGVRKIRVAGAEKRAFSRWANQFAKGINIEPVFIRYNSLITTAITLLGGLGLYYAALSGGLSASEYQAFNVAYGMVSGAFMSLAGIVGVVASIKPSLNMAKPILTQVPETIVGRQPVTSLSGAIEMDHVSFHYGDDSSTYVLDGLSLSIKPGEYVAIVGRTGCGKSTIIRLLLGFETPQRGNITFDKKNITSLDMKGLRRHIGIVNQNGKLIQGDIFSNIVITAPWLTEEDAWEAAEIAGIADDIRAMPMGMSTLVSEGIGGVSGGQKQRILIARAIAPKPNILIFDEATSALDNVTQRKIAQALDELRCTRIVIAHRLSTIRNCSRILVLDGGRIIADGSYEELLKTSPFFRELVERQQLDQAGLPGEKA